MTPTAEQQEIQAQVQGMAREFADKELRPRSAEWDQARALDEGVFRQLAGLDLLTYVIALEELARGDAAVALSVAVHNGPVAALLARHGGDAAKGALLPALASGERLGAFALSEPIPGSDLLGVSTKAIADGNGWRLTGTKSWVTNGERAGLAVVFARTGERALGAFLVELPADGWRVTGRERTMGLAASETVTVELDGVRVAHDRALGAPGAGLELALEAQGLGRLGTAAQAVGIARSALEHAVAYAQQREQFGQAIAHFGGIQEKLAEMARRVAAARAVTHAAAARMDEGEKPGGAGLDAPAAWAAIAKLTASETAMWVADEAVQVFGGYGYMRDYPVEKLMRDAKGTEIFDGTSEMLRVVIARALLRDAE
jgi:alkylation response protein AidB-like acyl-CoA dehydrogenase